MNVKHVARILIVDDEHDSRKNLEAMLCDYFTEVISVDNCASALSELKSKDFDVIVCDYKIDKESGLEIRKWQINNKPGCQFILLTGYASDPGIVHHLETDHFKVLQKPAQPFELILPLLKDFPVKKAS